MQTCVINSLLCSHLFSSTLEDDDLGHFEIDSKTGDIRTTELFSQDAKPYYTLKVTAKDSGVISQEDTAVIHVQVRAVLHYSCCIDRNSWGHTFKNSDILFNSSMNVQL